MLTRGVTKTNRGARRELVFAPSPRVLVSHDEAVRVQHYETEHEEA